MNKDKNGVGEIAIKSDSITKGYYKDEDLTKSYIINGWYHTGDLGKIDEDGYMYIIGRNNNTIVLENGEKVFPEEIEDVLNSSEAINESIIYQNEKGKISAIIECNREVYAGHNDIEIRDLISKIIDEINEKLPQFKKITKFDVVTNEFEKNSVGKIDRKKIIENKSKFRNKKDLQMIEEKVIDKVDRIREIIINEFGIQEVSLQTNLQKDLGADSLEILDLYLCIEKEFNCKFTREQKMNIKTVEDLLNFIKKQK